MILNHTVPVCVVYGFDSNDELTTTQDNIIYYRFFGHNLSIIKEAVKNNKEIIFPIADFLGLVPFENLQSMRQISYDEETDSLYFENNLRFINNFPNSDDKVLPIKFECHSSVASEVKKQLIIALYSNPLIYGKPWEVKLPEWVRGIYGTDFIIKDYKGQTLESLTYDDKECVIKIDNPNIGLWVKLTPKM